MDFYPILIPRPPHLSITLASPLLWTYVALDVLLGLTYLFIAVLIFKFVHRRPELILSKIVGLFAVMTLLWGLVRLAAAWSFWHPILWLGAGAKFAMLFVAVLSAVFLMRLLPKAVKLPSPKSLSELNQELSHEISHRQDVEHQLKGLNQQLEDRVEDRTRQLEVSNLSLYQHIIEQSQVEQALRESQELLLGIAGNVPAILTVKDSSGRYLLINRHFEQLFRLGKEEVLGKTDEQLFPDDKDYVMRAMDMQVIVAKRPLILEFRSELYGQPRTYRVIKFPIWDSDGKFYAVGGLTTDISELKRIEEILQLRTSKPRLDMRKTTEAIVKLDRQGRIESWSTPASRLYGWKTGAVLGRKFSDCALSLPDRQDFEKILGGFNFCHEKSMVQTKLNTRHQNGQLFLTELTIMSIRSETKPLFYIVLRAASG